MSTAHVAVPGATTIKPFYSTVEWEGKEYDAHKGTTVLMQVIADAGTDASRRTKALERLGRLRNRDMTPQLVALYERFTEREERLETIRCLISSEDPRGLPLFARILEHEKDEMVRLYAAVALAQWNVRRGVAELIRAHEKCKDATSSDSYVCKEAANEFAWFNTHKGWGFPQERVREALLGRSDLDDHQRRELYLNEIKNWWRQNEHRFPDWKLGDPLPEVPSSTENAHHVETGDTCSIECENDRACSITCPKGRRPVCRCEGERQAICECRGD
ncbi:MAG: HEAT repeat domain-containing protein [Phycisphaerae bacterium]